MPGPHREHQSINDNEIESQTSTEKPQVQRERLRSVPVWQLLFVRTRTMQLLLMRLQEVALPKAMAALANAGAASPGSWFLVILVLSRFSRAVKGSPIRE